MNPTLAADERVKSIEGLNARDISGSDFEREEEEHSFDLVVADLSFISMTHVLPTMARYLAAGGDFISLVKFGFFVRSFAKQF